MVTLRVLPAVCAGELESFTCTVIEKAPDRVGVRLIPPVVAFKINPVGKAPAVSDQLYGVVPPAAERVTE